MLGSKEDGLFVGAFDLDAVGLDAGIIFERVVHDPPIESVHRFEFDDVPPAADFFGGLLGFAHESLAGLGPVAADIDRDFRRRLVLLKQEAIDQVLQVGKGLTLAADETAGVFGLDVEQHAVFEMMFFDGGRKAQVLEELFESGLRLGGHGVWEG